MAGNGSYMKSSHARTLQLNSKLSGYVLYTVLCVCALLSNFKTNYMTNKDLIEIGFKKIPHFTIANSVIYPLGRHRLLSAGCVGTPNEMLWICETDNQNETKITDLVCIHNWDYDGTLTIEKVKTLINTI